MSRFIKNIDNKHLVSVGDEGFYCNPNADENTHWTENCGEGVDTIALTKLPHIDVMSFHLYPDHWSTDAEWGTIGSNDTCRMPIPAQTGRTR